MRAIKTLQDAAQALQDLETKFLSAFDVSGKLLDFKKRRISNLSPSVDEYDAVTRKELLQQIPATTPPQASSGLNGRCVFGIGINTDIIVQDDCVPRHTVTFPETGNSGKQATIIRAYSNCKEPPVGSTLKVDIIKNFGQPSQSKIYTLEVAEGDDSSNIVTSFDDTSLIDNDLLTASVTQIGSVIPGSGLYISIRYVWQ